eukprot:TRINITY_DN1173_c0_g1_i1.p1 TRINITY_DN1173_c0_g1~~TRINITY_DN1173_c0_g1_i1.p1  ORF type:complete len:356 (+),score=66.40 TRINITY_DN1173_c0_g1_i1:36-1103(+)
MLARVFGKRLRPPRKIPTRCLANNSIQQDLQTTVEIGNYTIDPPPPFMWEDKVSLMQACHHSITFKRVESAVKLFHYIRGIWKLHYGMYQMFLVFICEQRPDLVGYYIPKYLEDGYELNSDYILFLAKKYQKNEDKAWFLGDCISSFEKCGVAVEEPLLVEYLRCVTKEKQYQLVADKLIKYIDIIKDYDIHQTALEEFDNTSNKENWLKVVNNMKTYFYIDDAHIMNIVEASIKFDEFSSILHLYDSISDKKEYGTFIYDKLMKYCNKKGQENIGSKVFHDIETYFIPSTIHYVNICSIYLKNKNVRRFRAVYKIYINSGGNAENFEYHFKVINTKPAILAAFKKQKRTLMINE